MKKSILAVALTAFFIVSMQAQETTFGIKTGLNFSKFGQDADADGRTSFHVGGIVDIPINETFHIQPEVLYSGEGSEDLEANFVRILGVAKYFVADGFSLEGGPQFGIRVSADRGIEDAIKSFDFGVALGGGYELADIPLFFNARYNLGIANISDIDGFDTNLGTFQLSVGYKFE